MERRGNIRRKDEMYIIYCKIIDQGIILTIVENVKIGRRDRRRKDEMYNRRSRKLSLTIVDNVEIGRREMKEKG